MSRARPATKQSAACNVSPAEAPAAFESEMASFRARYPVQEEWGQRDFYKYWIFAGTENLKILEKYRGCMSEADFTANLNNLNTLKENGIRFVCGATSSDGGAGCVSEYP